MGAPNGLLAARGPVLGAPNGDGAAVPEEAAPEGLKEKPPPGVGAEPVAVALDWLGCWPRLPIDGAVTVIWGTEADFWAASAASFAFFSASAFCCASLCPRSRASRCSRSTRSRSCRWRSFSFSARSTRSRSSFSLASRSISFFRFASRIFIIARASSSCFSHFENTFSGVRGLPIAFVLSDSPATGEALPLALRGEPPMLAARLSACEVDAMRLAVGM